MKYLTLFAIVFPASAFALCPSPTYTGNARLDQQSQAMYMSCFENERRMKAQQEEMEQQRQQQIRQQQLIQQQMQEQQNQLNDMQQQMNRRK